ncbi:TIR domain-containing protein [Lentzea sp. NBRC 102530]|uniref:TIR domain-containing protein n=1 Tax=Lentzea sp. NBRC 102530 TaxID=3032201 RepID=UPI0024A0E3FF|nr:TIR domain-containing protein [Lentzea sp. NBRC 102530]GLY49756.1 hypothetical protein Lesp01_34120 [Lentzea sp. NBRC 102530]
MREYEFDVAPSFAGENRAHVLPVVRRLQELGVSVFYDEDHLAELWGVNLVERLFEAYGKKVRYVLLFASKHYVARKRTKVERETTVAHPGLRRHAAGLAAPAVVPDLN